MEIVRIIFVVCEDAEQWQHGILCDLNKVNNDEWMLKLETKQDKTKCYKKGNEEEKYC